MTGNGRTGWTRVALGDVARQVKDKVNPASSGLQRYVAGEHMDSDSLRITRWGDIGDDYLGPAFTMRFKPGHILYGSRRTYLRKLAVADFEGICANTTFVIEPSSDAVLPDFLPLVLTSEAFHAHSIGQSKGSVNPYVNFSDLTWFEFDLPPLDEQRRLADIAAIHKDVEHAATVTRQAWEVVLASYLKKICAVGPTEQRAPLSDLLADSIGGIWGEPEGVKERNVDVIRSTEINELGKVDLTRVARRSVGSKELQRRKLQRGDLLLEKSGGGPNQPVGRVVQIQEPRTESVCSNFMQLLRPDESRVDANWLFWILYAGHLLGTSLRFQNQTTGIRNLRTGDYLAREVPLPAQGLQTQVAATASRIRTGIVRSQESVDAVREFHRSVINEVLSPRAG